MPETQTGYFETNGAKLYYEVAGEGHPLVFVHAGIADSSMWDEQFQTFAQYFRVIRYDTRGFGKTTTQDVEYSNRADLLALLDHLGVQQTYIVGCSRGGQIATDFTVEFPNRVAALVPVCAGLSGFSVESLPEEEALFEEGERLEELGDFEAVAELEVKLWVIGVKRTAEQVDAGLQKRVYDMILANGVHANEGGKPIVLNPPAADRLKSIHVPTLVIITDSDVSDVQLAADVLVSGIRGARRALIENSAHVPNMERPDEFNQILLSFLQSLTRVEPDAGT